MIPADIKARMAELQKQSEAIVAEVKTLQEQCTHPEFVRGITIIACVQEVDICSTCGWAKPIVFDPLQGGEDYTSRHETL